MLHILSATRICVRLRQYYFWMSMCCLINSRLQCVAVTYYRCGPESSVDMYLGKIYSVLMIVMWKVNSFIPSLEVTCSPWCFLNEFFPLCFCVSVTPISAFLRFIGHL